MSESYQYYNNKKRDPPAMDKICLMAYKFCDAAGEIRVPGSGMNFVDAIYFKNAGWLDMIQVGRLENGYVYIFRRI